MKSTDPLPITVIGKVSAQTMRAFLARVIPLDSEQEGIRISLEALPNKKIKGKLGSLSV